MTKIFSQEDDFVIHIEKAFLIVCYLNIYSINKERALYLLKTMLVKSLAI